MVNFSIFDAPKSVIADGLEGKVILIYGGNNLGKTAQAVRFPKPFVMACELGLNGIGDISYLPISRWSDFKIVVGQLTDPFSLDKAKEMYSTIIVDEVYASSLFCQEYVCQSMGNGALTLADGDSKHNLYSLYEKEYFKQINLLTSAGYTVVFIAHEQTDSKTGKISPKGDKRCIAPIIDRCDYVVYLRSNGVDENNKVIKSSGFLAETPQFFARAKIEYTPTYLKEFTMESLRDAITEGIKKKREIEGATVTSYSEQQKRNVVVPLDFAGLKDEFNKLISSIPGALDTQGTTSEGVEFRTKWYPKIMQITEKHLGKGGKVFDCTENQAESMHLIVNDLKKLLEASN